METAKKNSHKAVKSESGISISNQGEPSPQKLYIQIQVKVADLTSIITLRLFLSLLVLTFFTSLCGHFLVISLRKLILLKWFYRSWFVDLIFLWREQPTSCLLNGQVVKVSLLQSEHGGFKDGGVYIILSFKMAPKCPTHQNFLSFPFYSKRKEWAMVQLLNYTEQIPPECLFQVP